MRLLGLFLTFIGIYTLNPCFSEDLTLTSSKILTPSSSGKGSYEDNSQLIKQFYECIQTANVEKLNTLLEGDYHVSNAGDIQDSTYSRFTEMSKNLKVRAAALHKSFPDFVIEVSELLIDGNKVLASGTLSGIQKGNFLGIAPTNKPIHLKFFDVFTIKEGKIVNLSEMWNELSVMKQLGFIIL